MCTSLALCLSFEALPPPLALLLLSSKDRDDGGPCRVLFIKGLFFSWVTDSVWVLRCQVYYPPFKDEDAEGTVACPGLVSAAAGSGAQERRAGTGSCVAGGGVRVPAGPRWVVRGQAGGWTWATTQDPSTGEGRQDTLKCFF